MAENADPLIALVGLLARGSRSPMATAEPAAAPLLDCRTAVLAPLDARCTPDWQPLAALLAACRDDRVRFQAEVLGRTLWRQLLAVFASEWHGVLDDAGHRLEPVVVELARNWRVPAERIAYDMAGIGRSFGSLMPF